MSIQFDDVKQAVNALQKQDKAISVRSIRTYLGGTGSLTTISKHLALCQTVTAKTNKVLHNTVTPTRNYTLEQRVIALESLLNHTIETVNELKAPVHNSVTLVTVEMNLNDFSTIIQIIVNNMDSKHYGHGPKIFIAVIYQQTKALFNLSITDFKKRLHEAHQKTLLKLAREDMPIQHDETMIKESEITFMNATYHYVRQKP